MKVFISWSGTPSRELAEALHWWLPKVIQGTIPFVSAKDIDKGADWNRVLSAELTDTDFGIICLTPENLASPWLNYEAGAITKSVDSRVCPLLLQVSKDDVSGPFRQLQMTELDYPDVLLMLRALNKAGETPLTDSDLEESAKMWWPRLEERVKSITVPQTTAARPSSPEPEQPRSSEVELLHEILDRVRRVDARLGTIERADRHRVRDRNHPIVAQTLNRVIGEGLPVLTSRSAVDGVSIAVESIPEPLPGESWKLLSELAKSIKTSVRLVDTLGRQAEFTSDGQSTLPPF